VNNLRKAIVFHGREALITFIIEFWKKICVASIGERGQTSVALSGGRTPVDLYSRLAWEENSLPWEKIHIFLVDERFVPWTDRDSNYGMIRDTLLRFVSIPEGNVHPIGANLSGPDQAAEEYEKEIVRHFRLRQGELPRFDLVLLGLGEDGHTASLFPGSTALRDADHLAGTVRLDKRLHDRITLTLPVINNARHILFQVEGANKAEALKKVVEKQDPALPASLIDPAEAELLFLADKEAACLLSKDTYIEGAPL
jgi:6-phosphogluconolactonase